MLCMIVDLLGIFLNQLRWNYGILWLAVGTTDIPFPAEMWVSTQKPMKAWLVGTARSILRENINNSHRDFYSDGANIDVKITNYTSIVQTRRFRRVSESDKSNFAKPYT